MASKAVQSRGKRGECLGEGMMMKRENREEGNKHTRTLADGMEDD
jgi:hypothetical protein